MSTTVQYDPLPVMREMTQRVKLLFPQAFENHGETLPEAPEFGHLFAGLVQLADWLGSDTRFFCYSDSVSDRASKAWNYAKTAISTLGLDAEPTRRLLNSGKPNFSQAFDVGKPYPVQEMIGNADLGSLVILESETGSGKTEAALWRYIHLFRTGQVDGLYFALPTRVSATQIYRIAQAKVLTPKDHDLTPMFNRVAHGLGRFHDGGGVYPDLRIIEATSRLIDENPEIVIPDDNRKLVEGATHPDQLLKIQREKGKPWEQLGQEIEGDTGAQRTIGHLHALETDEEFAKDMNMAFPDDHRIATRLGVQDRLVQFDPPLVGPFGKPLRELPIRHFLVPSGLDPDTPPSTIELTGEGILFNLGPTRFCYSRLGLERLSDG